MPIYKCKLCSHEIVSSFCPSECEICDSIKLVPLEKFIAQKKSTSSTLITDKTFHVKTDEIRKIPFKTEKISDSPSPSSKPTPTSSVRPTISAPDKTLYLPLIPLFAHFVLIVPYLYERGFNLLLIIIISCYFISLSYNSLQKRGYGESFTVFSLLLTAILGIAGGVMYINLFFNR